MWRSGSPILQILQWVHFCLTLCVSSSRVFVERVCNEVQAKVASVKLRKGCRQPAHVVDHDVGTL